MHYIPEFYHESRSLHDPNSLTPSVPYTNTLNWMRSEHERNGWSNCSLEEGEEGEGGRSCLGGLYVKYKKEEFGTDQERKERIHLFVHDAAYGVMSRTFATFDNRIDSLQANVEDDEFEFNYELAVDDDVTQNDAFPMLQRTFTFLFSDLPDNFDTNPPTFLRSVPGQEDRMVQPRTALMALSMA